MIDGCPCPAALAPYVRIVLDDAGQTASSIYRGQDPAARAILHRHGKHTQAELFALHQHNPRLYAPANPPGQSSHELRSDQVATPRIPRGKPIAWWECGIDSGTNDPAARERIRHAALRHGWHIKHPYSSGVEGHHWNFAVRPRPQGLKMRARILELRATLPRR